MQYDLSELKKGDFKEKHIYNATMSYHQVQILGKIGTEESHKKTEIKY